MYFFDRFLINYFVVFESFISKRYVTENNRFVRKRKMSFKEYVLYILTQTGCTNFAEAHKFYTKTLKHEFESITRQAIGKQRRYISPKLFLDMSESFINELYTEFRGFSKFKGYIICACDGSIFDLPNTPTTKKAFGIPLDTIFERFLSRGRVSCMLDVNSKHILISKIVSRSVNEISLAIEHLNNLNERFNLNKFITIYDRAYGSAELMINTIYFNSKFLIRLNKRVFKDKINNMKTDDEIIEINITKSILNRIKDDNVREFAEEMGRLKIRIVKVKLKTGEIEILATNLNNTEFTKKELKELYAKRWTIETGYDKLKNFIKLEDFSGIRKEIIEQDFYAGIFIYNLATTVKFDIEKLNNRETKNKDKKYDITANFSSIITLIYDYLFQLVNGSKLIKEKIIDFILLLVSKELSYNQIKEEDELNSVKKPDYSTEHSGFKKRSMR